MIQEGWLAPRTVLLGGIAFFVVGGAAGFVLMSTAGWPILLLGLIGVPLAYGYTAPPLKLAYRGLGELNVFFLMGPVMVLGGFLGGPTVGSSCVRGPSLAEVESKPNVPIICRVPDQPSTLSADDLARLDALRSKSPPIGGRSVH